MADKDYPDLFNALGIRARPEWCEGLLRGAADVRDAISADPSMTHDDKARHWKRAERLRKMEAGR